MSQTTMFQHSRQTGPDFHTVTHITHPSRSIAQPRNGRAIVPRVADTRRDILLTDPIFHSESRAMSDAVGTFKMLEKVVYRRVGPPVLGA